MNCSQCHLECKRKFCSEKCYHESRIVHCPKEWIELYESGATLTELSDRFEKSVAQISVLLRRRGAKMRDAPTAKHRAVISNNRKAYFSDPLNRKKVSDSIKKYHDNASVKNAYRSRFLQQIASGNIKINSVSKLENAVGAELTRLGYTFSKQCMLRLDKDHVYRVDFLMDSGCVVEVNGTYWHCDPRKYPNGPVNDTQTRCVERQKKKAEQMQIAGIVVCEIWESDFRSDKCSAIGKLVDQITNAARNPNVLKAAQDALNRAGKK